MEENKELLTQEEITDEELGDVSGGRMTIVAESSTLDYVYFEFDYSANESRFGIRDYIKQQLIMRGVPQSVVSKVPSMNSEKSYMSYGTGGMRVEWKKGWPEPKYTKTHD